MKKWFAAFILMLCALAASVTQAQIPNQQTVAAAEEHLRYWLPELELHVQTRFRESVDFTHSADLLKEQATQLANLFRQAHAPYTQNDQTYQRNILYAAFVAPNPLMAFSIQEAMDAQNRNASFKLSQLRYSVYDLEILSARLANAKKEKRQQRILYQINKTLRKMKAQLEQEKSHL